MLTLDRVVSLRDFEDFSRAFAGIGKAQAEPLWQGERHIVFVSVAAAAPTGKAEGGTLALNTHMLDPDSDLRKNLVKAMGAAADPVQPFKVLSYEPLFFSLGATRPHRGGTRAGRRAGHGHGRAAGSLRI